MGANNVELAELRKKWASNLQIWTPTPPPVHTHVRLLDHSYTRGIKAFRGAKQGGGVSTPPKFWMGGLNACQPPPPDFEKKFFRGGWFPLI